MKPHYNISAIVTGYLFPVSSTPLSERAPHSSIFSLLLPTKRAVTAAAGALGSGVSGLSSFSHEVGLPAQVTMPPLPPPSFPGPVYPTRFSWMCSMPPLLGLKGSILIVFAPSLAFLKVYFVPQRSAV